MNKRTKKQKGIKDSWLKGVTYNKDLALPVELARYKLDGWSEKKVRGVWDELYNVFQLWEKKHGIKRKPLTDQDKILGVKESAPWEHGGYGISDSFDLYIFLRDTEYKELKPIIKKFGNFELLAVIILKEASEPLSILGVGNWCNIVLNS